MERKNKMKCFEKKKKKNGFQWVAAPINFKK